MHIVCEHCAAEFDLDLPPDAFGGGRSLRFRCSACGKSFTVFGPTKAETPAPVPDEPTEESPSEAKEATGPRGMLLKQEGKVYHVRDLSTLQRWIVERRVMREDLMSIGGVRWEPVGARPDLEVFFQVVEHADRVNLIESGLGGMGLGELPVNAPPVEPDPNSDSSDQWDPWVDQSLPNTQDDDSDSAEAPFEPALPELPERTDALFEGESADDMDSDITGGIDLGFPTASPTVHPPQAAEVEEPVFDDAVSFTGDEASLVTAAEQAQAHDTVIPVEESEPELGQLPDMGSFDPFGDDAGGHAPIGDADEPALSIPQAAESESEPAFSAFDGEPELTETQEIPRDHAEEAAPNASISDEWMVNSERPATPIPEGGPLEIAMDDGSDVDLDWAPNKRPTQVLWAGVAFVVLCGVGMYGWTQYRNSQQPAVAATAEPAPEVDAKSLVDRGPDPLPSEGGPEPGPTEGVPEAQGSDAGTGSEGPSEPTTPAPPPTGSLTASSPSKAPPAPAAPPPAAKEPPPAAGASGASNKSARSPTQLVDAGWKAIDSGAWGDARASFAAAIDAQPGNGDAYFGLGYLAENTGDKSAALRHYCTAKRRSGGQIDLAREVAGRLRALEGSCD